MSKKPEHSGVFGDGTRRTYPHPDLETLDEVIPDDYCEACKKRVANRECDHGILCDVCDEQVHGSVGGKCEVGGNING